FIKNFAFMKQAICLTALAAFMAIAGCQNQPKTNEQYQTKKDTSEFQVGIPPENDTMKHEQTEFYTPVPPVVSPGKVNKETPSDAITLFDGKDLNNWVSANDTTQPAQWTVSNGTFTVKPGTGNIQTKQRFEDYQLHLEWREPVED